MIQPNNLEHNHAPSPDPFQYHQHMAISSHCISRVAPWYSPLQRFNILAILAQDGHEIKEEVLEPAEEGRKGHTYMARGAGVYSPAPAHIRYIGITWKEC